MSPTFALQLADFGHNFNRFFDPDFSLPDFLSQAFGFPEEPKFCVILQFTITL